MKQNIFQGSMRGLLELLIREIKCSGEVDYESNGCGMGVGDVYLTDLIKHVVQSVCLGKCVLDSFNGFK